MDRKETKVEKLVNKFIDGFNNQLIRNINETNNTKYILTLNIDKIEVLQKDKKQEAEKNKIQVDTVLNIVKSVNSGEIEKESGKEILIHILSMSAEEVNNIIK